MTKSLLHKSNSITEEKGQPKQWDIVCNAGNAFFLEKKFLREKENAGKNIKSCMCDNFLITLGNAISFQSSIFIIYGRLKNSKISCLVYNTIQEEKCYEENFHLYDFL